MQSPNLRQVITPLRWFLYLGSGIAFIGGVQLLILARSTAAYFAWTVQPPLTAGVLGGFFWGALVYGWLCARERIWVRARGMLPAALIVAILTLAATPLSLDLFHLSSTNSLTRLVTYAWLAVSGVVPFALIVLLYLQSRAPGVDGPRGDPLPLWFRLGLDLLGVVGLCTGLALFVAPQAIIPAWGWQLTPLPARLLGAWLMAVGVIAAQAAWENDWERVRWTVIGLTAFGALQIAVLGLFSTDFQWESASGFAWIVYCMLLLNLGGWAWVRMTDV
jgi:hypothetical protein